MNIDDAKRDLSPEEYRSLQMQFNTEMWTNGILKDVDIEQLQRYMANPEQYKDELQKYAIYQYISNGDIFQLFDLVRVLPNLNYKIKSLKTMAKNDTHTLNCRMAMKDINHKELTRDILSQTISAGTLVGLWVGKENTKDKSTPYLMLFDDLEYFFPARRVQGKWTVWCDLAYFDSATISADKKYSMIENLSPYVTIKDYENYKSDNKKRYIEFPVERSVVLRTHTVKRNQRFGLPWNTQAIYDIKHKEKLRNLEKVASNKVMNAVAVLTLGLDNADSTWKKLGENLTKSVFNSVKKGLMENKDGEASVVGLPEWAKLEYPDQKTDVLNPDKIETINADINNSLGITRTLTNGLGGNYASANINLDIILNRIGELLENIESEVYNKMINIILPKSVAPYYYIEYEKSKPLTNKEKSDIFFKLHNLGYSLEPLVSMTGLDFNEYVNNSKFEIEELNLRDEIMPPVSSYTLSSSDSSSGRPSNDNATNESTIQSNEQNGNDNPKPSTN